MERLHDEADRGLRSTASVEICVRGSRNRQPVVVGGQAENAFPYLCNCGNRCTHSCDVRATSEEGTPLGTPGETNRCELVIIYILLIVQRSYICM